MIKKSRVKRVKNSNYRKLLVGISTLFLLIILGLLLIFYQNNTSGSIEEKIIVKKVDLVKVKENYHDYVVVNDGASLYKRDAMKCPDCGFSYEKESTVYGKVEVSLDPDYEVVDEYFKVLGSDYYVRYDEVSGIDSLTPKVGEYKYYKNYVVYNENVILKDGSKLYVDDINYYKVDGGSYPIIIKDKDRYGIEYNNSLVYVDGIYVDSVIEHTNTDIGHTEGLAVLNYHYVVSATNENGELDECRQSICITDTMFESHVKYLKDNGYYGVSMRDLELFIDGKIQLPEKSVSLTFDDGWYVTRTRIILERYQILGTLFLIGSLASPNDYLSPYLEVHSHTWDMHTIGQCPSSVGRGGILCLDEDTILEDLKKSRESLNNTTYFCYPFYDYNDRAIELLKQAGFTMAFAGQFRDSTVRVGQDKFKIPRYVIVNTTTMEQFIEYVS